VKTSEKGGRWGIIIKECFWGGGVGFNKYLFILGGGGGVKYMPPFQMKNNVK